MNESGKWVHALLTYYGLILKIYSSFTMTLTWKLEKIRLRAKDPQVVIMVSSLLFNIWDLTFNRAKIGIEDLKWHVSC